MTLVGEPESELLNERPIPDALQNLERDEFFAETSEHFEALDSPFLPREAGEVAPDALSASVGQNGVNRSNDVRLVQRLLNAHLPIPLAPLVEDGKCGPKTIFAIKTYQQRVLGMNPPDGRVDPGGRTFRSLSGQVGPTPIPPQPGPPPAPSPSTVPGPSNMRPAAWDYLLRFTEHHEGMVKHIYNNRPASSTKQDVTCGIGFLLSPREVVTQKWVKAMFYDPNTNQTPSDEQLLADWDAAANLARTATNLGEYGNVCKMRMYPEKIRERMALILRDQKLPALLKSFPEDFKDFANYPAAAQVFCVSFAYGRLPFDFPHLRTSIRDGRWADAAEQCNLRGASPLKNKAHKELLRTAQQVVDQQLDPDTLPPLSGSGTREFETAYEAEQNEGQPFLTESSTPGEAAPQLESVISPAETVILTDAKPSILALHHLLHSPEIHQATVYALQGKARHSNVRLHGVQVPVSTYLKMISHLCREVAEQFESETPVDGVHEFQLAPDPASDPNVIAALKAKDWQRALARAIAMGVRDENELANLIFFAKHQELPRTPLDPKNPKFKQLTAEWSQILNTEVWTAIQAASENTALVVSGTEVCDEDRFYWGTGGKALKRLVENVAKQVGLNPGLLGTVIMAETRSPVSYLTKNKVSSYLIGTDDFYEARAAIAARVPAYSKVHWDKNQTPLTHLNDATTPREVKSIWFDSGPDALLATAVYMKFREVRLREIAKTMNADFDKLPLATQMALTRIAMAAGTQGATPALLDALAGKDIFVRKNIPVKIYQTMRNATVRTVQAMHLSEWIFGIPVPQPPAPAAQLQSPAGARSNHEIPETGEFQHSSVINPYQEMELQTETQLPGEYSFEAVQSTSQQENYLQTEREHGHGLRVETFGESTGESSEALEEFEDKPPRGLVLLDHKQTRKIFDAHAPGGFKIEPTPSLLCPANMNPGFIDDHDEVVIDRSALSLQSCLEDVIKDKFSKFLSRKDATKADGRDRVRVAVVDLTGSKLSKPQFAGWGSTVAMYGASSPKMLAVYAAFQLRRDLRQMAEDQAIPTGAELAAFAKASWKDKKLRVGFPNLTWLFGIEKWSSRPEEINFTPEARTAFSNILHNDAASLIIRNVGFPYVASVAWQSGLRHPMRGGLWLSRAYDGGDGWAENPSMKAPAFVHNITALSVVTFYTLLAQGRLVDDSSSAEIKNILRNGCSSCLFPSGITLEASKCGIFKPFMHDCVLASHMGARYAAAILTEINATWPTDDRCPTGGETGDYRNLCTAVDALMVANQSAPKTKCSI